MEAIPESQRLDWSGISCCARPRRSAGAGILIEKFLVGDTVPFVKTMRTITTKRSTGSPSALPEHARVRLLLPFRDAKLAAGAMGTVVFVYNDGEGYEVEFIEGRSRPVVITVDAADIALAKK